MHLRRHNAFGRSMVPFGAISCAGIVLLSSGLSACSFRQDDGGETLYVRDIASGLFDTAPVRTVDGPLRLHRDGDAYECSMCHEGYRDDPAIDPLAGEHADIVFTHGLDQHCLHCHNPSNSDVYLNHDGTEIPGDQSTQLCGKCHGVTYRDWKLGVHGRLSGYWDDAFGPRTNFECIECHDPHAPRFPSLKPDPPPIRSRFNIPAQEGE